MNCLLITQSFYNNTNVPRLLPSIKKGEVRLHMYLKQDSPISPLSWHPYFVFSCYAYFTVYPNEQGITV